MRALAWLLLAAVSCTLPDYEKVESEPDASEDRDGGMSPKGPSCPMEIELPRGCRSCLATHCCEAAQACADGACGDEVGLPITPTMNVTAGFDALARCMLDHCDTEDTCDVSWGCIGNYKWPTLREQHSFSMRVFNYADPFETGLPNVKVKLCESSDPRCEEGVGFVTNAMTDSGGYADFTVPKGFSGYFQHEAGGPYPGTVQWSQPIYTLVDSFNHQALSQRAVDTLAIIVGLHDQGDQPFRPGTGHLITRMQNCLPMRYLEMEGLDSRAQDVEFNFTPQAGATQMYYVDSMAMIDIALDRTSSRGYAGAFEVQATNVTVTAKHAVTGETLASGVVPLREGTIGYMYLVPRTSD